MAFCDFIVRYNPQQDTHEELFKRILNTLYIKRNRDNRTTITFVGGDSGEGKSESVIILMNKLLEIQNINIKDCFETINICSPGEYKTKMKDLLHKPEYKKINVVAIHEARTLVKAKLWQSFTVQAIADINAMSRSLKRLSIFIVSQFIRDISTDVRYTLNYYIKVSRPLFKKARLKFYVMWKDDRDLEKPKLCKRKLSGYLVLPDGTYKRYVPQYIELTRLDKELSEKFDILDTQGKQEIIDRKLDEIEKQWKIETGQNFDNVEKLANEYFNDSDMLNSIASDRNSKKGWHTKKGFADMHDLSKSEVAAFEAFINKKMKLRDGDKDELRSEHL